MELEKALQWRYSVKQFSEQKVSQQNLNTLLELTRLSASSYGLQPYKIIVIESAVIRQQLVPYSYGQDKVANSSHLIIFAAQTEIGNATVDRYITKHNQITNSTSEQLAPYANHMKMALKQKSDEQKQQWAHQQAYIALGNFITCAAAMKIDTCPMTGFDTTKYDSILALESEGLTASVICPIGYRSQDDAQAAMPKVRFAFDELMIFKN
ncbi:NAD(P)H-dependent oxidoreductase [Psychrosphaera sp. F3M07]|uniref:NAD(P)H-dependent oxidoreductase n=1 Tax=Psychrosphaera sp. F3M07 TaxID=2841560 RepID=UPI001C09E93A|nr:NAD(P)H-dependent oxidoreductase [Psychrosphaera sp. F3M07]MBU2917926.1 NAD(P)H-dependent oxidoreductase [Psychrosphaera sp. F3M07]